VRRVLRGGGIARIGNPHSGARARRAVALDPARLATA